ncbi:MAG: thioredoxin family protein [Phycisphaerales bacterium]
MLTPDLFRNKFEGAQAYAPYVLSGRPGEQVNWNAAHARVVLTPEHRSLLAAMIRRINVLVISGTWCGDCVHQCPMFDHIAGASRVITLRFVDRDTNLDLATRLMICGGLRVPTVVFLNEDFEFVSILGDRVLSRYRRLAARNLGAACPLPGAPLAPDESAETLQDWMSEFERVHLLLRLSPKLRARHGD